jgi:ABC-2 type transport system permease protein
MRKVLWLAAREYKVSVRTKGFIIGLVMFPILMGGSGIAIAILKDRVDTTDKRIAVVDRSGVVLEPLIEAARQRNDKGIYSEESGKKVKPAYVFEVVEPDDEAPRVQRLELSNRVRDGSLHGFLEISADAVHPSGEDDVPRVAYYAKNAIMDDARDWMAWPINTALRSARVREAGLDESDVGDMFMWLSVEGLGLLSVDEKTGTVRDARRSSEGEAILVPLVMGMLMFMMIMMGAVPLLHSVMEEKTQRIAEVLLGSVSPFQFMAGKVLGGIAVSLTASAVYVAVGVFTIRSLGAGQLIPYRVLPWFFVYMLMAIVMYGAMLAAFGASCNEAKDAQNLTMPGMMPVMIPMFVMFPVLKEPLAGFATGMSLFPLFTPMLMMIRVSTPMAVPGWQPWVGLAGILVFTVLSVWAAGRIFRVAILMQGRPPRLGDLLRWAVRG